MRSFVLLFLVGLAAIGCEKPALPVINKFADSVFIKIKDFQDHRLSDSLDQYLTADNAGYRTDAALAFASIQDSTRVQSLGKLLLDDPEADVRQAAAFALGQTACRESEQILLKGFDTETDDLVLAEILESYGKVSSQWKWVGVPIDSVVDAGLAWAIYRSGLRGQGDSVLNQLAGTLLKLSTAARLGAAQYFARGATNFDSLQREIITTALQDFNPNVRMAAALALKKLDTDSARQAAQNRIQQDTDYRVRINALRALQAFPFEKVKASLLLGLQDENINVAIAASEVITSSITSSNAKQMWSLARAAKSWRVCANLFEAALSVSNDKHLFADVLHAYDSTSNSYFKAALLNTLQHVPSARQFVEAQLSDHTPVIRSSAASALVAMNRDKNFNTSWRKHFAAAYIKAIGTGDPAVIGIIASALADDDLGYKNDIKDYSFLYAAKTRLSLPKDNEALQPLEVAIAYFEGNPLRVPVQNEFNHPIDWQLVKTIPRNQQAIIKTTKGDITINLFVEEAPGSVANFVALARKQYFNNKFVHRVVPNFVIQAGCSRGDGWGSEDYSIRSEFTMRRYTTGSMGMASAGKDTEGTQWFITHSPTPHLDGRYTIFAEVETGMDIVDQIEVGDKILNIELR